MMTEQHLNEVSDSLADKNETQDVLPTPTLSSKQKKSIEKQEKQLKKLYAQMRNQRARANRKLATQIRQIKNALGKEDFKNLKDICTIHTPEQKGPNGEVVQKAQTTVNYRALVAEGRQALVLNRQARIETGKRKRSTGRSSQRVAHSSALRHVNMRSLNTAANEEIKK